MNNGGDDNTEEDAEEEEDEDEDDGDDGAIGEISEQEEEDEDEDEEEEEDDDDADDVKRQTTSTSMTAAQKAVSENRKRRDSHDVAFDAELDPDLYGLRRSVRRRRWFDSILGVINLRRASYCLCRVDPRFRNLLKDLTSLTTTMRTMSSPKNDQVQKLKAKVRRLFSRSGGAPVH